MVTVSDRVERRHMLEKDKVRTVILWTPILDVVDDSPTNSIRNRKGQRLMGFLLDNGQLFIVPIEIAKTQSLDVADAKSENTCQYNHGVVTFPDRTCSVDNGQEFFQFLNSPGRWDCSLLGYSWHVDLGSNVNMN